MEKTNLKPTFKIALIGVGWIGKTYIHAVRQQQKHPLSPEIYSIATTSLANSKELALQHAIPHYTDNWKEFCYDDQIDLICIASPVKFHFEQAKLALENKKNIALEKPIVLDLEELTILRKLAKENNCIVNIGYNYIHNPMLYTAKKLLAQNRIGDIVSFNVFHSEDFMSQQSTVGKPWHYDINEGASVLRDVGSHALSILNYLLGDIQSVIAMAKKQYEIRGNSENIKQVTIADDHVDALIKMNSGVQGRFMTSWVNSGRSMHLGFEIYGNKGAICFNQERSNELSLYTNDGSNPEEGGRTTIRANTNHPEFSEICPADEHGYGFMDLKSLEMKSLLNAVMTNEISICNLEFGAKIEHQISAMIKSYQDDKWIDVIYE